MIKRTPSDDPQLKSIQMKFVNNPPFTLMEWSRSTNQIIGIAYKKTYLFMINI